MREGYLPLEWKAAQVILIRKNSKAPVEDLSNLRPISLLPILSKVLEKYINICPTMSNLLVVGIPPNLVLGPHIVQSLPCWRSRITSE